VSTSIAYQKNLVGPYVCAWFQIPFIGSSLAQIAYMYNKHAPTQA